MLCRFLGRRHDSGVRERGPASEKRQGTKSREVGPCWCSGLYGDWAAAGGAVKRWCRQRGLLERA